MINTRCSTIRRESTGQETYGPLLGQKTSTLSKGSRSTIRPVEEKKNCTLLAIKIKACTVVERHSSIRADEGIKI